MGGCHFVVWGGCFFVFCFLFFVFLLFCFVFFCVFVFVFVLKNENKKACDFIFPLWELFSK